MDKSTQWIDTYWCNKLMTNWEDVLRKSGQGMILKIGQGRQSSEVLSNKPRPFTDREFMVRYELLCSSGNTDIGTYWFCTAYKPEDVEVESEYCLNVLDNAYKETGVKPKFVALDIEDFSGKDKFKRMGKEEIVNITLEFIGKIRSRGYNAVLYSNLDFLCYVYRLDKRILKLPIWLAFYNKSKDVMESRCKQYGIDNVVLWQCGVKNVAGVGNNLDISYSTGCDLMSNQRIKEVVNEKLESLGRHPLGDDAFNYIIKYRYGDDLMKALYMLATNERYNKV